MFHWSHIEFLQQAYYGLPLEYWAIALALGLVLLAVAIGVRHFLLSKRCRWWSGETTYRGLILTLVRNTRTYFLVATAFYTSMQVLEFPDNRVMHFFGNAAVVTLILQLGVWAGHTITFYTRRQELLAAGNGSTATTLRGVALVARMILWVVVVLLILENIGVHVSTLVASLGIGGVAVALAVQNVLGDLFASLSIVLDKPFVIGDFIIVGDRLMGTVEHVGLKSTRVRSLEGEQIVFSNANLLKGEIRNYKRMFERRVEFGFGVSYQTTPEQLELIPVIIKDAILAQDKVRFDRAHFAKFSPSSLDCVAVFFVLDPDYNLYMDIQQAINLAIYRRFREEGIQFAHPIQSLRTEEVLPMQMISGRQQDGQDRRTAAGWRQ